MAKVRGSRGGKVESDIKNIGGYDNDANRRGGLAKA